MRPINPLVRLLVVAALALTAFVFTLPRRPAGADGLVVYCAAVLRPAMDEINAAWRGASHESLRVQYGGSNTLASLIGLAPGGDVFLSADEDSAGHVVGRGWAEDLTRVAVIRPTIAVPLGNPLRVASVEDLQRVRVAIANPDQAAIGRLTQNALKRANLWPALVGHVRAHGVMKPTVGDVANDIVLGSVDAGIVWDATIAAYDRLESVPAPELQGEVSYVCATVLTASTRHTQAQAFRRFLLGEQVQQILTDHGFQPPTATRDQ